MKVRYSIGLGVLVMSLLTGCSSQGVKGESEQELAVPLEQVQSITAYNSAFERCEVNEILAMVINEPTLSIREDIANMESYVHYKGGETMLVVPKYNGSTIEIRQVAFDGEKLVEKEVLYRNANTPEDYGLLIETMRPEGMPELLIKVSKEGREISYVVAQDERYGTPDREYLKVIENEEIESTSEADNLYGGEWFIYPREENDYLQGYHFIDQKSVDLDGDLQDEQIEVYSTALLGDEGDFLMDDGANWCLIVRKGDQIYPLFDEWIQLGKLEYKVYYSYEDEVISHVLITKAQGAGLTMYDCYYDKEQDVFVSKVVYETIGNIGFSEISY